jgi:hypothetical protein
MILWQANLGRGVSTGEFRLNLRRVLHAGGPRAVFCFQEIDEADGPEEMDYLRELTDHSHRIVGVRTAVPILVPRHIEIIGGWQTLACRGLAKFTPNRPLNQAQLRIGPNLDVTVLNFHVPLDRPQTHGRRASVRRHVRAEAKKHPNGVWVADTNTHRGWPTIRDGEHAVTDAGIDKAKAWAAAGRKVVVSDHATVNLSIDGHDAHGARVRWEKS